MTASTFYDRAKMTVSSTGTGTITLNAAVAGYQTFAAAGVTNGTVVSYVIEDASNTWEIGQGTYTSSGTTLTRGPVASSSSGSAISMTSAAVVYITARAVDLQSNVNITGGNVSVTSLTCSAAGSFQGVTFGIGAGGSSTNLAMGGLDALTSNSTGTFNTAIGAYSLQNNTTGQYNMALGTYAMNSNVGGSYNTAIGATACFSNVSGQGLVGIGLYALHTCTANYNTGIGTEAGYDVSSGTANTIIGYNTGRGITTGSNNTVIGGQVTGLSSGLTGAVILATGDGTIQMDYNASVSGKWSIGAGATSIKGRTLLATLTASSSASLSDTTHFTSSYNRYEIVINNLVASTSCDLVMTVHSNGSQVTSGYAYSGFAAITSGGTATMAAGSAAGIYLTYAGQWSSGSPGLSAEIEFTGIQKQPGFYTEIHSMHHYGSAYEFVWVSGTVYNTSNIDGVYFTPSSGTLTSGTILIYGVNE